MPPWNVSFILNLHFNLLSKMYFLYTYDFLKSLHFQFSFLASISNIFIMGIVIMLKINSSIISTIPNKYNNIIIIMIMEIINGPSASASSEPTETSLNPEKSDSKSVKSKTKDRVEKLRKMLNESNNDSKRRRRYSSRYNLTFSLQYRFPNCYALQTAKYFFY